MSSPLRTLTTLLLIVAAGAVSLYLSRSYRHADVRHGVEAVQAHLYGEGGEAHLISLLETHFHLQSPRLEWRGRVVSNVYGVVEVVLTARDATREVRCVWEMGLVSGDLVARNEAAATLLRAVDGAGSEEEGAPSRRL